MISNRAPIELPIELVSIRSPSDLHPISHRHPSDLAQDSRRCVALRCTKGYRSYDWCEPFSPLSTGETILKCRAVVDPTSGGLRGSDTGAPLYLRLNVTMIGSRRTLVVRPALDVDGHLRLPFRVSNRSQARPASPSRGASALMPPYPSYSPPLPPAAHLPSASPTRPQLLLAFCQQGLEDAGEHWDLLGAGEACDFTWDRPGGVRALSVRARDATGVWHGEASSQSTATGAGYPIEKISEKLAPLRLKATGGASSSSALPVPAPPATPTPAEPPPRTLPPPEPPTPRPPPKASAVMAAAAPPTDETLLLTASCILWAGGQCWAKGWLCVTQNVLTFLAFSAGQMAAALAANDAVLRGSVSGLPPKANAADAVGADTPLPVTRLPLPLASIGSVDPGLRPGQLLIKVAESTTASAGATAAAAADGGPVTNAVVIGSLRTADQTLHRLRSIVASQRAAQHANETMSRVREQMAASVSRRWLHKFQAQSPEERAAAEAMRQRLDGCVYQV